jgi:hypothetical protein
MFALSMRQNIDLARNRADGWQGGEYVKITRIYADARGETHFADAAVPTSVTQMFPNVPPFGLNRFAVPRGVKLFSVPAEFAVADWHTAPERQLSISLNGTVEYETSDGAVRRCAPGHIVLVEDTTGRGHITRFDQGEQWFLHIPVPDDWPGAA